ncbi:hypothetical protein PF010_g32888 [Phytophthora fragariae]|uniref:Uncharacterized protein n=1 Tax=Phytophthora fragariae TaxID=53985 RepID=A0A6G0JDN3_9STRA|nr:hypothetical protein PF010_g32888 [Phytophthora fragariae]KAE9156300.1 hypothetical protein PF004_g32649 [Phytophthora fragariae]
MKVPEGQVLEESPQDQELLTSFTEVGVDSLLP